jgi:hypothetical protein
MTPARLVALLCLLVPTARPTLVAAELHLVEPAIRGADVTLYADEGAAAAAEEETDASVAAAEVPRLRVMRATPLAYQVQWKGKAYWVHRGDVVSNEDATSRCAGRRGEAEVAASRGLGGCP